MQSLEDWIPVSPSDEYFALFLHEMNLPVGIKEVPPENQDAFIETRPSLCLLFYPIRPDMDYGSIPAPTGSAVWHLQPLHPCAYVPGAALMAVFNTDATLHKNLDTLRQTLHPLPAPLKGIRFITNCGLRSIHNRVVATLRQRMHAQLDGGDLFLTPHFSFFLRNGTSEEYTELTSTKVCAVNDARIVARVATLRQNNLPYKLFTVSLH